MGAGPVGRVLTVAGASLALIGAFGGWGRSGETMRSSFELVGLAQRLGVLSSGPARLAVIWFALPALVGVVWVVAPRRGRVLLAVSGAAVAVLAGASAALVLVSPLGAGVGLWLSLAGSALTSVGLCMLVAGGRSPT